ncbi:MAG: helix-turn-helix transcriptional regulator [Acidimicrobiales bacterium]
MTALFERESALAAIDAALRCAGAGGSGVLALVGEAGLGKTTLLARLLEEGRSFRTVHVVCSEIEGSFPFGVLDRLLGRAGLAVAPLRAHDGRMLSHHPGDARVRRYEQLLDWLESGIEAPLLLAVDDLHWADPDSIELLCLMCRRLERVPVTVVVTMRPFPHTAIEQAMLLAYDGVAQVERLLPLSDPAGAALLAQHLGKAPGDDQLQAASRAAAGNPLLLVECAAALAHGEDLTAPSAGGGGIFLPRFAGVGAAALHWARAASVLSTRFRPVLVAELAGQSEREAAASLQHLCSAGLVRSAGDGKAEFVHPLVRQALYEDLAPLVREGLHASAFRLLRERGAEAEELLSHALSADLSGDASAASMLAAAGERALAAGAVATAAQHLARAVEISSGTAPPGLRLQLSQAWLATGDLAAAEDAIRETLRIEGLPVADRVRSLRLLAQAQFASAKVAEAKRTATSASMLAAGLDRDLAVEIRLDSAYIDWLFEGIHEARRAIAGLGEGVGGAIGEAARVADAHLAVIGGDATAVEKVAASAAGEMPAAGQPVRTPWQWDILFSWANIAKILERFDESERSFEQLDDTARSQGAAVTLQTLAVNHADTLWRTGELGRAKTLLMRASELVALVPSIAPFSYVGLAHVDNELGDDEGSARWAAKVEELLESSVESPYLRLWLHHLECRRFLAAGEASRAARAADAAAEIAERYGILEPCVVPWHASAIDAYLALGELERAEELSLRLSGLCQRLPCRAPRATARAGLATVSWLRGQDEEAYEGFQAALEHHRELPMPLAEAETLLAFGRFCRRSGRGSEARALLGRALELVTPVGARRIGRLVEYELALAGGRRRGAGRNGELTVQERRVAELAAEGLTSPAIARELFISAKTVDHHLSHVYAKLGIASRRELMRAWPC